jgi:hypothetical protein
MALELSTFALNPATGDLEIPLRIVRGAEAVAQRVRVRFRWFLGEWFLDTRQGVPYFRDILIKNPDPILISFIFRQVLMTTPGVKRVESIKAALDRGSRALRVDFAATLDDDSPLTSTAEPFIIG